jgi:hypothetical protein
MITPRFRVRTLLIVVAVAALALGAETTRRRWAAYRYIGGFHWGRMLDMRLAASRLERESVYFRPNLEREKRELAEAEERVAGYEAELKARGPSPDGIAFEKKTIVYGSLERNVSQGRLELESRRHSIADLKRLAEDAESRLVDYRKREVFHERQKRRYLSCW